MVAALEEMLEMSLLEIAIAARRSRSDRRRPMDITTESAMHRDLAALGRPGDPGQGQRRRESGR